MPRIPIACTLEDGERAARGERWRAVITAGLQGSETIPGGVRLRFSPDPAVTDEVAELVAGERACCAWADWALRSADGGITLEATAPEEGADALRAMFAVTS